MTEAAQPKGEILSESAKRFKDAIDAKFQEALDRDGEIAQGPLAREHEESIRLIAQSSLLGIPNTANVYAIRPIPEEAGEAAAKWPKFGGYRIMANSHEGDVSTQTDFLIRDGKLAVRTLRSRETRLPDGKIGNPEPI